MLKKIINYFFGIKMYSPLQVGEHRILINYRSKVDDEYFNSIITLGKLKEYDVFIIPSKKLSSNRWGIGVNFFTKSGVLPRASINFLLKDNKVYNIVVTILRENIECNGKIKNYRPAIEEVSKIL